MRHTRRWIALGLVLAAPILLAQTVLPTAAPAGTPFKSSDTQKSDTQKNNAQKQIVLAPLPALPSHSPTDQIPETPAKVSYQDGLLTISAENSSLGEILRAVRKLTGASIEIPPGSGANERVVTHLGPGAPREVLALLLNGSAFSYVMVGSDSDPTAVASVVLIPSAASVAETQTAANAYQNNPGAITRVSPPQRFNQPPVVAGNGQASAAEADDSKDDEENTADTAEDQVQPEQAPANAQEQAQQQPDQNLPNAGPKTPEQILEMLRRQQQPGAAVVAPQQPPPQEQE